MSDWKWFAAARIVVGVVLMTALGLHDLWRVAVVAFCLPLLVDCSIAMWNGMKLTGDPK